jgi:hypothetical protein
LRAWTRWVERHRGQGRDAWLADGFVAAGYRAPQIDQRHAWELVRAVAGEDYLSFNAQRALERLTDHRPPLAGWPQKDACHYWLRWLRARRLGYRLEAPPARLLQLCG